MQKRVVPRKKSGFRYFVDRHEALFAILGAFIVFLGFFVREGVMDRSRELASVIQSAEADYSLRAQLVEDFEHLEFMEQTIESRIADIKTLERRSVSKSVAHELKSKMENNRGDEFSRLAADEHNARQGIRGLRLSFELVDQVFEALPKKRTDLANSEKNIQLMFAQADTLESDMDNNITGPLQDNSSLFQEKNLQKIMPLYHADIRALDKLVNGIWHSLDTFIPKTLQSAKEEQKAAEMTKGRATTLSYLLFVVGWISGLLGRILKIPALSGGDE
jgi:hypothetical protein